MKYVLMIVWVILLKSVSTEPSCSKFHYEEKLLEKMIRFEYEMRDLKKEIQNMMTQTSLDIDNFKQDIASLQAESKTFQSTSTTTIANAIGGLEKREADMMAKQAGVLKTLEDTGRNLTQDITTMKDTFNARTPLVSFRAHSPRSNTPSPYNTIIYEAEEENLGGGYDASTGVFVAPVAGLYLFSVHVCANTGQSISFQLVTQTTTLLATYVHEKADAECSTVLSQAVLEKGNRVWVKCYDGGTLFNGYGSFAWNAFSGFLIHT